MTATVSEVLEFVKENDVKFIRLAFCDLLGRPKNISIMPDELPMAFEQGISFDAHAISGFTDITKSDLFLVPDPTTISVLPWRPQQGRVARFYCNIKNPDGSAFWGDSRAILQSVLKRGEQLGYSCMVGAECEFYLFKTDEKGEPTLIPFDQGGYLDVAPLDKGRMYAGRSASALKKWEFNLKHHTTNRDRDRTRSTSGFPMGLAARTISLPSSRWSRALRKETGCLPHFRRSLSLTGPEADCI